MGDPRARATTARALLVVALVLTVVVTAAALAACGSEGATSAPAQAAASGAGGSASAPRLVGGGLPPGCRCHSQVKWLVAMHKLFSVQDCTACHSQNENLMASQGTQMTAAHLAALKQRMRSEPVCLECHQKGGTSVPARFTAMNGAFYCPTDGKLYTRARAVHKGGAYYCPRDGTKLVDVDAITAASEKKPSNAYCLACHPQTAALRQKHAGVAQAAGVSNLSNCLSCHPSHSRCGSCHH